MDSHVAQSVLQSLAQAPWPLLLIAIGVLVVICHYALLLCLHSVAPKPRLSFPSEKTYLTSSNTSATPTKGTLACWFDRWLAERHVSESRTRLADPCLDGDFPDTGTIEPAEVRVSVVFPAYNEEHRILPTLEEAVAYLDETFGRSKPVSAAGPLDPRTESFGSATEKRGVSPCGSRRHIQNPHSQSLEGYEILVVDDGSKDRTVEVCLEFARQNNLHDILRVVKLERNRGKGGAVTHGMRHARGDYVLFADADGASKFSDLERLVQGCEEVVDGSHRGVAIGSRAHLVGSDAVVKRSALRNFLMRSFHLVLMILTPPATSRLRDTQCGFKLFTRAALPHIVPYMHAEGWIFDIEMLLLAESAPPAPVLAADGAVIGTSPGIHIVEVPIDWHEVEGSKMSIVTDSLRMAIGLAVLRASWMMGVYRRRLT